MINMRIDVSSWNPFAGLSESLIQALRDVQLNWAKRLEARVEQYPARRSGQTYIRTFRFRDEWTIVPPRMVGGDLVTSVISVTPYAVFVIGNEVGDLQNQAYHAGRWYLFRRVVEDSEAQLRAEAQAAINRVLRPATITP